MWLDDGLQRYELTVGLGAHPTPGDRVDARELSSRLRHAPRHTLERVVDFLVTHFAWSATDMRQHDAALARLSQLVEERRVTVVAARLSASDAGSVPDEDDVTDLSELVDEDDDSVDAALRVQPPTGVEGSLEVLEPDGFEFGLEIVDPDIPDFDIDISAPDMPAFELEHSEPDMPAFELDT